MWYYFSISLCRSPHSAPAWTSNLDSELTLTRGLDLLSLFELFFNIF